MKKLIFLILLPIICTASEGKNIVSGLMGYGLNTLTILTSNNSIDTVNNPGHGNSPHWPSTTSSTSSYSLSSSAVNNYNLLFGVQYQREVSNGLWLGMQGLTNQTYCGMMGIQF